MDIAFACRPNAPVMGRWTRGPADTAYRVRYGSAAPLRTAGMWAIWTLRDIAGAPPAHHPHWWHPEWGSKEQTCYADVHEGNSN